MARRISMRRRGAAALALAALSSPAAAGAGPDVIVGDLPAVRYWGASEGITAYSVATTSCNIGDQQLLWIEVGTQHPVIAQNLYRIKDGRLEQIGMSWLKHGFCALQETLCASLPGFPPCSPAGQFCEDRLGVGCSDPYSANLNGNQSRLGPRSHVDAFTASYPWPFAAPAGDFLTPPPAAATIGRRLQVPTAAIDPALNAGAVYLIEGQYVTADDAAAGNALNNASYREVTIQDSVNGIGSVVTPIGGTQRQVNAVEGWHAFDAGVVVRAVDVPGEGRFHVASKAIDNGDGSWTYVYAVRNHNSHLSAGSLSVPVPCGTTASDMTFHAPAYHSGELYSNEPWGTTVGAGSGVTWATEPFGVNPNANALRWATAYTFTLTADGAPATGSLTLGLFREAGSVAVGDVLVPGTRCRGDWTGEGSANSSDISAFLTDWLASVQDGTLDADFDCSGGVNSSDISAFLSAWLVTVNGGC